MTVIRRSDGREWRIEPSDGGIPLVFGDGKYDHDPPRVASGLESALADQLAGAVAALRKIDALLEADVPRGPFMVRLEEIVADALATAGGQYDETAAQLDRAVNEAARRLREE